jgi:lipopolysaccharide transport system permease protein
LVRWKGLFAQFLARAIARQYRSNMLGFLWAVMVPLITLGIYSFVFGVVMASRWDGAVTTTGQPINYTLYLFAGLVVFWLLAQTANEACTATVNHANLVKKTVFPVEIIPLVTLGTALFHTVISTLILIAASLVMLGTVPATALLFPIVLLPFVLLLAGFAWILAALGVYFRDLNHVVALVLTAVLFLSPVFYATSRLSTKLQTVVLLNPVSFIVDQTRAVLLEGSAPNWVGLAGYLAIAWVVSIFGLAFFRKSKKNFADVL